MLEYTPSESSIAETGREFATILQKVSQAYVPEGVEDDEEYAWYFQESLRQQIEDPYVRRYIEQVASLKLYADDQIDQYNTALHVDKPVPGDRIVTLIKDKYARAVDKLHEDIKAGPAEIEANTIRREYPHIDDEESELPVPDKVYRRYAQLGFEIDEYGNKIYLFSQGNKEDYLGIAEQVAAEMRLDKKSKDLLSQYASLEQKHEIDVLYREKVDRIIEENSLLQVPEVLLEKEQEIRSFIERVYSISLPRVIYVPFEKWKEIAVRLNIPLKKTIGGGYIHSVKEGDDIIPLNTCFVLYSEDKTVIETSQTVFEELYHASGQAFQNTEAARYWPGWKDDGSGSLMEEGLAGAENYGFFTDRYKEEFFSPGTTAHIISQYLQGEKPKGKIPDIWPTIFMRNLIEKCGGDEFMKLLRSARMNQPGVIERLTLAIDSKLGKGAYDYLSQINGHDIHRVKNALKRFF